MAPFPFLAVALAKRRAPQKPAKRPALRIEPGIDFEATHVLYHVTVRNRGGPTLRDVVITPKVLGGPFFLDEPPKAVPVLDPRGFGTATFRVGARGEPGEIELGGRVSFWDEDSEERHEAAIPAMQVDLRPPATRPVYLSPGALRERASWSLSVQDVFDLPLDAERAFPVVSAALADVGLEKVEEITYASGDRFVGQASFHGLDARKSSYAVRAVASRTSGRSSMKLLVFVQAEERLFGFYWRTREAVHRALGLAGHHP